MIFTPDYSITLPEGQRIDLLFSSYFYKKYCERKGIELHEFLKQIGTVLSAKEDEEPGRVKGFTNDDMPEIILVAHQVWCHYNKIPCDKTEADAYLWIDAMGGLVNGMATYSELFKVFVARLFNIDPGMVKTTVEELEEKKSPEAVMVVGTN